MKASIIVCLAIVAGAAASFLVSRTSGDAAETMTGPPETRMVPVADPHAAMAQHRIAALEQRVANLAAERTEAGAAPSAQPADGRDAAAPHDELVSEDDARARRRSSHEALLASVQAQGPDPSWSTGAEEKFTSDLGRLGAHVQRVDCRKTACVATIEWPSRAQAQQQYRSLIKGNYQLPCDRQIFLDRAAREDAPYRATLVLDCEHVRANL
jgi:hypothetical protein